MARRVRSIELRAWSSLWVVLAATFAAISCSRCFFWSSSTPVKFSPEDEVALPIKLWSTGTCPFAQRAWIVLKEKHLPYEMIKVDLQNIEEDFKTAYAKAQPSAYERPKVPAVQTADGFSLIESDIVAEYLEERFSAVQPSLLPGSPELRAKVRLLSDTFDKSLMAIMGAVLQASGEVLGRVIEQLQLQLRVLDSFLELHRTGGGPFLLGRNFSLAEVHAAPFLQRILVTFMHFKQVDLLGMCNELDLKLLRAWIDAVLKRRSVKETGVPSTEIIKVYEPIIARLSAAAR